MRQAINNKTKRLLKKQAEQDFQNARGYEHLAQMKKARKELETHTKTANSNLKQLQNELAQIDMAQEQELRAILTKWIIDQITEVAGIGPQLANRIISQVFVNDLSDLRRAHMVDGIGDERQWSINQWVREKEHQIPAMLAGDFPGKQQIIEKNQTHRQNLNQQIESQQAVAHEIEKKIEILRPYIEKLEKVSADTFWDAFQNPTSSSGEIDQFIKGIYAEWEEPPDWYKALVLKIPAPPIQSVESRKKDSTSQQKTEVTGVRVEPSAQQQPVVEKPVEVKLESPKSKRKTSLERNESMDFKGQGNWVSDVLDLKQGVYKVNYQADEDIDIDIINVSDGQRLIITYGSRKGSKIHHIAEDGRFVLEIALSDDKKWSFELSRLT